MMNRYTMRQSLILFLTAFIWGVAFVAQSAGMEYVEPFTYNGVRSILGGLVLLPYIAITGRMRKKSGEGVRREEREEVQKNLQTGQDNQESAEGKKQSRNCGNSGKSTLLFGGLCCGTVLFAASNFQQFGIKYTTVGKAGFITAMYILIVPIIGLFLRKKAGVKIWVGVGLAVAGLYLLCMKDSFKLEFGDSLVLVCAFVFAVHILVIDYFTPKVDGVKMACIQFWVCGILSLFCAFVFETPNIERLLEAWLPICYAGILSSGVAYTLQIVGQKGMNPTVASLIMSLESVIAAISGFLLLGQAMSMRELTGCFMMFAAIILAQLPERGKKMGEVT